MKNGLCSNVSLLFLITFHFFAEILINLTNFLSYIPTLYVVALSWKLTETTLDKYRVLQTCLLEYIACAILYFTTKYLNIS